MYQLDTFEIEANKLIAVMLSNVTRYWVHQLDCRQDMSSEFFKCSGCQLHVLTYQLTDFLFV